MRGAVVFVAGLLAQSAWADPATGQMPAVNTGNSILDRFATDQGFGTDPFIVVHTHSASTFGTGMVAVEDFAAAVQTWDSADVISDIEEIDPVGLSFYPPMAVILLDGELDSFLGDCGAVTECNELAVLSESGIDTAKLVTAYPVGSPNWLSHILLVDVAAIPERHAAACAARLSVATLYQAALPSEFSFTRCARSLR